MDIVIKTKEIKSLDINELDQDSPLGKEIGRELEVSLNDYYRIERIAMEDHYAIGKLFINGMEALRYLEFGHTFFIPKAVVGEKAVVEAELVPSYKVIVVEGEDENCWFYQEGEETHEVLRLPTRASRLKELKAERIEGEGDVFFDEYECKLTYYHEYWLSFKMPPYDIRITPVFEESDEYGTLVIDDHSIFPLEYASIKGSNYTCTSFVTDAQYSDDYDFDCVDHYFQESPIKFKKGVTLRVELALLKEAYVFLYLGGKEYKPLAVEKKLVSDDSSLKERVIYVYHYRNISFKGDCTMTFRKRA